MKVPKEEWPEIVEQKMDYGVLPIMSIVPTDMKSTPIKVVKKTLYSQIWLYDAEKGKRLPRKYELGKDEKDLYNILNRNLKGTYKETFPYLFDPRWWVQHIKSKGGLIYIELSYMRDHLSENNAAKLVAKFS